MNFAPLVIERSRKGLEPKPLSLTPSRWARLKRLAVRLNVRRRGESGAALPSGIGALLEGLATGRLGVVRMDDAARRVLTAVQDAEPARDPRCPGDWED